MPTDRTTRKRGRPPGYTLTPAESDVIRTWRDTAVDVVPGQGGRNLVLADALGVREAHLASGLSGSIPLSHAVISNLLRYIVASDEAHGGSTLLHLDARGSETMRDMIRLLRTVPRETPRPVGRGRAAMVGGVA